MLTDAEKAALKRAAKLCEFHAVEWGVASGQNTAADAATLRALIARAGWRPNAPDCKPTVALPQHRPMHLASPDAP